MHSPKRSTVGIFACAMLAIACNQEEADPADFAVIPVEEPSRLPCTDRSPLRNAFFGDLHVHTALSVDAWNYDMRVRPDDAYRYAFGGSVRLPPNDANGHGSREVRLDRPLDFAAVTDHAEVLGELMACTVETSPVYDLEWCKELREASAPMDSPTRFIIMNPFPSHNTEVCGENGQRCIEGTKSAWRETIEAAEKWNDRSDACVRTALIGFEYSSFRMGSNLHRNVIFRTSSVPSRPISYVDANREWELWQLLKDVCRDSGTGCDALAIPHNSNISNGRMFSIDYPGTDSLEEEAERAALRISMEPVVEVMQHKGDSECGVNVPGVLGEPDEACGFEKLERVLFPDGDPSECWDTFADWTPHLGPDCLSRRNYARYALTEGLAEEKRIGVNPFKFGLMASTDTHNGIAGAVEEKSWPGHLGIADGDLNTRFSEEKGTMGGMGNGPGGIIGVWAEENSRTSIFDAIARREVFGTSGPRISPRFFGGWDIPVDVCESGDPVAAADARATPMGSDLPARSGANGPSFVSIASADPGSAEFPGGDLQRIQIIKGWVDDDGGIHQAVFDVAGGDNGASVDLSTCEPKGQGARELCSVWQDPEFDPARRAVYYARVLENPSCRFSAYQCLQLPEDERPPGCAHERMSKVQQERAWTSPIWYTPALGSSTSKARN